MRAEDCIIGSGTGGVINLIARYKISHRIQNKDNTILKDYSPNKNTCIKEKLGTRTKIVGNTAQIRRFLQIWSHLLEKSLMENFTFCAVKLLLSIYIHSYNKKNGKMRYGPVIFQKNLR